MKTDHDAAPENKFPAENLRRLEFAFHPDPRSISFARIDSSHPSGFRPLQLADHHEAMAELRLHKGVPEDVTIQFETAKNLFMYAWFIYRFHAVAEHQALTCLEFGLRERFGREIIVADKKKKIPGLKRLLRYGVDRGFIKNEGFRRWHDRAATRAQHRYSFEKGEEMREKDLNSIALDYSEVVISDQDRDWNLIEVLVESLPYFRNEYAHGTGSIHNQVRGTLELTAEILNQVFPLVGGNEPR